MTRTNSGDRLSLLRSVPPKDDSATENLAKACAATHHACLGTITWGIKSEDLGHPLQPEFKALVLAAAQLSHSLATLLRERSEYVPTVLRATGSVCQACADACLQIEAQIEEIIVCRDACLNSSQACMNYLQTLSTEG